MTADPVNILDLMHEAVMDVTSEQCVGGEAPNEHDVAEAVRTKLTRAGWEIVCTECGHVPEVAGITHQVAVRDDDRGESGYYVCLWDCGHEVRPHDGPCKSCTTETEMEPF